MTENEARILYTVKKGIILQSKSAHFEKNRSCAYIFSSASRATAWPLHFTFLPMPMNDLVASAYVRAKSLEGGLQQPPL